MWTSNVNVNQWLRAVTGIKGREEKRPPENKIYLVVITGHGVVFYNAVTTGPMGLLTKSVNDKRELGLETVYSKLEFFQQIYDTIFFFFLAATAPRHWTRVLSTSARYRDRGLCSADRPYDHDDTTTIERARALNDTVENASKRFIHTCVCSLSNVFSP